MLESQHKAWKWMVRRRNVGSLAVVRENQAVSLAMGSPKEQFPPDWSWGAQQSQDCSFSLKTNNVALFLSLNWTLPCPSSPKPGGFIQLILILSKSVEKAEPPGPGKAAATLRKETTKD